MKRKEEKLGRMGKREKKEEQFLEQELLGKNEETKDCFLNKSPVVFFIFLRAFC